MKMHVMVALMATGFVTGCGFIPKKPPLPDTNRRIPVNLTAPVTRPWSAPSAVAYAAPQQISTLSPPAGHATEPSPAHIDAKVEIVATLAPSSDSALPKRTQASHNEQDPVWPITQKFDATDSLDATSKLAIEHVTFQWPAAYVQAPVVQAAVPADVDAGPISIQIESIEPAKTIDTAAMLEHDLPLPLIDGATTAVALVSPPISQTVAVEDTAPSTKVEPERPPLEEIVPEPTPAPDQVVWSAEKGITVSEMLQEWASKEDWTVRWDTDLRFSIEAQFSIEAPTFLAAANQIFKAYRNAGYAFTVTAYRNQVLVVTDPRK